MHKYWRNRFSKFIVYLSAFMLIFNATFLSAFLISPAIANAADTGDGQSLCQSSVDAVIIMDISASMESGDSPSRCEWQERGDPSAGEESSKWYSRCDDGNTDDNDGCASQEVTSGEVTEVWCADKDIAGYGGKHASTYYPAIKSKIDSAKDAANSFIDDLGVDDQSAVVSFSDLAVLNKLLSSDHVATQSAINSLTTGGATNIGDAIVEGTNELNSVRANEQSTKVMILLTDGKANKPDSVSDPETYAEQKAQEAADLGYKIFTIGLGDDGDINQGMLQNIADTTGAKYYKADNGDDLSDIYGQISTKVCEYSSISGCKWNDENGDGEWQTDDETELLATWEIQLSGDAVDTQYTDEAGCYQFSGLEPGDYIITEVQQSGWVQTYPSSPNYYQVNIPDWEQQIENIDFGNYFQGSSISGYKYQDLDNNTTTDEYLVNPVSGWGINLFKATSSTPFFSTTTDEAGYFEFTQLPIDDYVLSENLINDWIALTPSSTSLSIEENGQSLEYNFINYLPTDEPEPYCGDGEINQSSEQCDDSNIEDGDGCSSICEIEESTGIQVGDIVINEIMQNPDIVIDKLGEWFELYNTTNSDINIQNCTISDNGGDSHIIQDSLIIPSLGYSLLAKNGDPALNGGISPDYVYSGQLFSNASDEIILTCDGIELDRVEYDGGPLFPDPNGASMNLAYPTLDNNVGANWCTASSSFGNGDLGTPGQPNDLCPGFYGSLSITKYEDMDGDLTTTEDQVLASDNIWEFTVSQSLVDYATTTIDAFAVIPEIYIGDYTLAEIMLPGWYQVGTSFDDSLVSISTSTPSSVSFYNTRYGSISGYKYEDIDGTVETTEDQVPYPDGWLISLFDSASSTIPLYSTTTNALGYFEFNQLVPGEYYLSEETKSGWEQLDSPTSSTTPITILSGTTSTQNNFINYFIGGSGGEEPTAEPQESSSGGGGFTPQPKVELVANYALEKELGDEILETLVVSNPGNIILTHGKIVVDLPESQLKFINASPAWASIDLSLAQATWNIDALAAGGEFDISFSVLPLSVGQATTLATATFNEAKYSIEFTETINSSTTPINSPQPPTSSSAPAPLPATVESSGPPVSEIVIAGESDESPGTPTSTTVNSTEPGQVKGISSSCDQKTIPWWIWLIVVVLHLWSVGAYSFFTSPTSTEDDLANQPSKKQGKVASSTQPSYPWLWWTVVALSLLAIYLLLTFTTSFPPLVLSLVLIFYFAVLVAHHYIVANLKQIYWPFIPLLLAIGPIAVYLFVGSWSPLEWIAVIGFYLASLILYYKSLAEDINSDSWWLSLLFLTLLALTLELIISFSIPCLPV